MRLALRTLLLLTIALLPICAAASESVILTGWGNYYGICPSCVQAYPYYLWTKSQGQFDGMCDDWLGATTLTTLWQANDIDLTGGNVQGTKFGNVIWYEEAGYIIQKYAGSDPVNANVAVWSITGQLRRDTNDSPIAGDGCRGSS